MARYAALLAGLNPIGFGIDEAMSTDFYQVMRQVFQCPAGINWTPGMSAEWHDVVPRAGANAAVWGTKAVDCGVIGKVLRHCHKTC